ncbi:Uncharacterised protein [Providencia rustigianii]|nr:Uncharacterised protein [Providencia rustigianii]
MRKYPDKPQSIFIVFVMMGIAYYAGSVLIYFFNGYDVVYLYKHYQSDLLWQLISENRIKSSIRLTAIPALLIGLVIAFILPVTVIYFLNQEKLSLHGDAKFASDTDLKKSKLLKWGKRKFKRHFSREAQREIFVVYRA